MFPAFLFVHSVITKDPTVSFTPRVSQNGRSLLDVKKLRVTKAQTIDRGFFPPTRARGVSPDPDVGFYRAFTTVLKLLPVFMPRARVIILCICLFESVIMSSDGGVPPNEVTAFCASWSVRSFSFQIRAGIAHKPCSFGSSVGFVREFS